MKLNSSLTNCFVFCTGFYRIKHRSKRNHFQFDKLITNFDFRKMAEDLLSFWKPLNICKEELPQSLGSQDSKVLSLKQKRKLKEKVQRTRREDLEYLNEHPEIRAIIREFLNQINDACPIDLPKFGRQFFGQPREILQKLVHKHVKDLEDVRRKVIFGSSTESGETSTRSSIITPSSIGNKCASVSMSSVLKLPKYESETKEKLFSSSISSTSSPTQSVEIEFEAMEEHQNIDWICNDCTCIIK